MMTLGIETSCDETSVALLSNGDMLASEVFTQTVHSAYGGVVPELASRAHLSKVDVLAEFVLRANNISPGTINCIAVTDSPGLAGALLVGISFALGLHCQHHIPVTGVNHLEGHICSLFLACPDLTFPFLALIVSGGHTAIYRVDDFARYACLGQTVDDAAGEAFDKVGKLLGFAYPAGRAIENEALSAGSGPIIPFPVARCAGPRLDFSFSGLKTAVKYFCMEKGGQWVAENRARICFSFQKTLVDSLARNLLLAAEQTGIRTVGVAGGVACNAELRRAMVAHFGDRVFFPPPALCTDNAAMIARAGYERFRRDMLRFPRMSPSLGLEHQST
jgi:N6-L-threonylcarbamoyladenine synthase